MTLDGSYEVVVKTPLGDQRGVLTVVTAGDRWSGSLAGAMGGQDIPDGAIVGDRLCWTMAVTKPMALSLDCDVGVEGDTLQGTVKAGMFGTYPMQGKRTA